MLCQRSAYVNTWMHSGMVMVDAEKMSNLGNFFTIRDVLGYFDVVDVISCSSHYRSELNYTEEHLKSSSEC